MASPRVFVSSTCYDLQEVRHQLRQFIQGVGYDPVMSEFGDIFYDLDAHVQDSCRDEIRRCHMFILIVGNNYGSFYHRHADQQLRLPDSVTLQEFRRAMEIGIPKFIFINQFVLHDFENYRRLLSKFVSTHFNQQDVPDNETEKTRLILKSSFDENYSFPQDSYRYIFAFLEIIRDLKTNNGIFPFESFDEIRDSLRRQWAGLIHLALTKEKSVPLEMLDKVSARLERIENQLQLLAEGRSADQSDTHISIDVRKLAAEIDLARQDELQSSILDLTSEILREHGKLRVQFEQEFTQASASVWLERLGDLIRQFKWSKYVSVLDIFDGISGYWKDRSEVPYRVLLELHAITSKVDGNDRDALATTIAQHFNKAVSPQTKRAEEDIPF